VFGAGGEHPVRLTGAKRDKIMETLATLHREQRRHEREAAKKAAE
jgi:hypothetical protein